MEDKNLKEAWAWLDEEFRLDYEEFRLDSESPLAISHSLWSDFAQSEAVVRSLFPSTLVSHVKDSVSPSFSFGNPDSPEHRNSCDIMTDHSPPPFKRRRMLKFNVDDSINMSPCLLEPLENCSDSLIEAPEDLQANCPSSSRSMWYMHNENLHSSVDNAVEQSVENWMVGCFSDSDASDVQELAYLGVNPSVNAAASKTLLARATESKSRQTPKPAPFKVACPLPQSLKSQCMHTPGKVQIKRSVQDKLSQSQHFKECPNPVLAYPFALLKPSGIQGDITLQDINQRINMPPPRVKTGSKQSKDVLASPFSGKPVLALTKIYTEGKGTITIMKTRS